MALAHPCVIKLMCNNNVMNRKICIIQARMGSERLPGKVLMTMNGQPMLGYQLQRLKIQMPELEVVVATSEHSTDDPLYHYCLDNEVAVYRGDQHNVLKRFHDLVLNANLNDDDMVIRLTGDCPLICPDLINELIVHYLDSNADYGRIDTDSFPRGVDAEVFTVVMLKQAYQNTLSSYDQEHVTPYFYHPDSAYSVMKYTNKLGNHSHIRLCVDEVADFDMVNQIVSIVGNSWTDINYTQLIEVISDHPEITQINQAVKQR